MDTKRVGTGTSAPLDQLSTPAARSDRAGNTKMRGVGAKDSDASNSSVNEKVNRSNYDVNLSPRAREMAEARRKATEIAKQTPDVREDRVEELRKKIASGEYQADSGKIADGMLQEAIKDELATQAHEEAKSR